MKRFAVLLFPLALTLDLAAQTSLQEVRGEPLNKVHVTFAPTVQHLFGETEYDFMQTISVENTPGDTVLLTGRSLLEFPLDVLMVGGTFAVNSAPQTQMFWSVEMGVFVNVNDPGGFMRDSDWIRVPGLFNQMVSFTESDAKMDMFLIDFEGTRQVFELGHIDLAMVAGFRYQKITQAIIGFDGWFLDTNFVKQPQSGSAPAIDYEVTYKGPRVGMLARIDVNPKFQMALKSTLSLVWADDFDDHLLRSFHTFAKGTGLGVLSSLDARRFLSDNTQGNRPYVGFYAGLDYYTADIKQTFEQYADGGPSELPVGTTFSNLPHELRSVQLSVGLRVGLAF